MYVDYETFAKTTVSDMTEDDYNVAAAYADLIIDHWTLGRVGRDYREGWEMPSQVVVLYCAIVENVPACLEGAKVGKAGLVSSFSNGVDSYSFDNTEQLTSIEQRLKSSLGWMVDLLPVEWISACVPFEGGVKYAG